MANISVRHCVEDDRTLFLTVARVLHDATGFADLAFSSELALETFNHYLNDHDSGIWILEVDGHPVGGIMAVYCQVSNTSYEMAVVEKGFFILPDYRGMGLLKHLLTALEQWSRSKGSKYIYTSASSLTNQTINIQKLKRSGYKTFSTTLVKLI